MNDNYYPEAAPVHIEMINLGDRIIYCVGDEQFDSLERMPAELRDLFIDRDGDGLPDNCPLPVLRVAEEPAEVLPVEEIEEIEPISVRPINPPSPLQAWAHQRQHKQSSSQPSHSHSSSYSSQTSHAGYASQHARFQEERRADKENSGFEEQALVYLGGAGVLGLIFLLGWLTL